MLIQEQIHNLNVVKTDEQELQMQEKTEPGTSVNKVQIHTTNFSSNNMQSTSGRSGVLWVCSKLKGLSQKLLRRMEI